MQGRIVHTAEEQIRKYGFRKFTVDDIAADLGISKKTIYKYFDSKKQIISAVVDTHLEMEKQGALKAMKTEGSWQDKLKAVVFFFENDKAPAWLLDELQRYFPEEWSKTEDLSQFKGKQIRELLELGIKCGDIRPDIQLPIIELAINKTIDALVNYKFLTEHNLNINQSFEDLGKIIMYGILKRD